MYDLEHNVRQRPLVPGLGAKIYRGYNFTNVSNSVIILVWLNLRVQYKRELHL